MARDYHISGFYRTNSERASNSWDSLSGLKKLGIAVAALVVTAVVIGLAAGLGTHGGSADRMKNETAQ